jgi:hypothetical protein
MQIMYTTHQHKRKEKNKQIQFDFTGTKICPQCQEEKLKTEFFLDLSQTDSLHSACKDCHSRRRQAFLDYLLKRRRELGPCVDCEEPNAFLLQWDHVRGKKRRCVSECQSVKSAEKEISKCVLRCVMCHRRKTLTEARKSTKRKQSSPREARADAMRAFVNMKKQCLGCCNLCGLQISDKFPVTLYDFDHLNPDEKCDKISAMLSGDCSRDKVTQEIAKCQLLCANCHWLKTAIEGHYYDDRYRDDLIRALKTRAQH